MTTNVIVKPSVLNPRTDKHGKTTLYIEYHHDGGKVAFKGVRVDPKFLEVANVNGKNKLVNPYIKRHQGHQKLLKDLKMIRDQIDSIASDLNAKNIAPEVRLVRDEYYKDRTTTTSAMLADYSLETLYDEYMLSKKSDWAKRTYSTKLNSKQALLRFYTNQHIKSDIREIDLKLYDSLKKYFLEVEKVKTNTFGKIIKDLKAFMMWAKYRGYEISDHFQNPQFERPIEDNKIIYELAPAGKIDIIFQELRKLHIKFDALKETYQDEWLTTKQAAEYLRKSIRTLQKLRDRGEIKFYPSGGKILYKKSDLDNYLEQCSNF